MRNVSAAPPTQQPQVAGVPEDDALVLPGCKDPAVVAWQRQFIESFISAHAIKMVGPHKVSFTLPPGETISRFVKEASEVCDLFLHQKAVSPRAWDRWEYRDSFHEVRAEPHTIVLDASPRGGANLSFPAVRSAFKKEGRSIATTAEVVAGHLTALLVTALEGLSNRESRLAAESARNRKNSFAYLQEYTARSFLTGPVCRSSDEAITYNSMVGLDVSDFGRDKASPSVSVIERLSR